MTRLRCHRETQGYIARAHPGPDAHTLNLLTWEKRKEERQVCTRGTALKEREAQPDISYVSILARLAGTWARSSVRVAPLVLAVAVTDWSLKAGVVATGSRFSFHELRDKPFSEISVLIALVGVGMLLSAPRSRANDAATGLILGAALGNLGELLAFGRVTNFIPFPPGWLASPADLCGYAGLAILYGDTLRVFWGASAREAPRH